MDMRKGEKSNAAIVCPKCVHLLEAGFDIERLIGTTKECSPRRAVLGTTEDLTTHNSCCG